MFHRLGGIYATFVRPCKTIFRSRFCFSEDDGIWGSKADSELTSSKIGPDSLDEVGQPPNCSLNSSNLAIRNPQSAILFQLCPTLLLTFIRNWVRLCSYFHRVPPALHILRIAPASRKIQSEDPLDVSMRSILGGSLQRQECGFLRRCASCRIFFSHHSILEELIRRNVRPYFHTPNGLHVMK